MTLQTPKLTRMMKQPLSQMEGLLKACSCRVDDCRWKWYVRLVNFEMRRGGQLNKSSKILTHGYPTNVCILAEGAIALLVTLSGSALFAS